MKHKLIKVLLCTVIIAASATFACGAAGRFEGSKSVINANDSQNGYITAKYTAGENRKIKIIIEKDGTKYTYDLKNDGLSENYPLQMGDGNYKIRILQNTSGDRYATIQTVNCDVKLNSQFSPYLASTQFINFTTASTAVQEAQKITQNIKDPLQKVDKIYDYVSDLLTYDDNRAATVQSGYVPDINAVVSEKKGICFDYSAVMASMLRSQNIPTKLIMGFVSPNGAYHAWNEVYIDGIGWIKTGDLYFDGKKWQLMDATFLSGNKSTKSIINFIKNTANYKTKYQY